MKYFLILFFLIVIGVSNLFSQDYSIESLLKDIENGKRESVSSTVNNLLKKKPDDANLMFISYVLIDDGADAAEKFRAFVVAYPKSPFYDDALYKLFTYFYACGVYSTADEYMNKLKKSSPLSPYLNGHENEPLSVIYSYENSKKDVPKIDNKSEKEKPTEKDNVNYKYALRVGAFSVKTNAEDLDAKLKKAGYSSRIELKKINGSDFYCVFAGNYPTESDIKKASEKIEKEFKVKSVVEKL